MLGIEVSKKMDALSHLVDAPLANILVLAGLAFLGIATLGKITGKIDPGTSGRVMAGVLGAVLFVSGIYAHVKADRANNQAQQIKTTGGNSQDEPRPQQLQPSPASPNSPLAGTWKNDNPQTRGIPRLDITQNGEVILVHAWNACSAPDCDWGTERGVISGSSVNVAWDQGIVLRKMTITPDAGRLLVVVDSVYRDNRPSRRLKEYFVRGQ